MAPHSSTPWTEEPGLTLYFTAMGVYDSMLIKATIYKYLEGKKEGRGGGIGNRGRERRNNVIFFKFLKYLTWILF